MKNKKKNHYLAWLVAILLVGATVGTYVYVHHLQDIKAVKLAKQKKIDEKNQKTNRKMLKQQAEHLTKPMSWDKPSETLPYPDIKKYKDYKPSDRVWLSVSLKKQRLYVHQGPFTLYTMYAYANPNYENMNDNQRTPLGVYKIYKNRGTSYYDAPSGYYYHAWLSYGNKGKNMIQSVPTTPDGKELKVTKVLGKKYKKKHVINTNGAIWVSAPDAKWLSENIPAKTVIVIQDQKDNKDPYRAMKDYLYQMQKEKKAKKGINNEN